MDSKESHITTFVRMAPWGTESWTKEGTALQVILVANPRADKKNVAVNPAGVVIKAHMEAYHEGSKALVRRHTTCVPTRANRRFTRLGAWRVRCGQLLKQPFISGISSARARLEKF
jgi:hypothetical protein